MAKDLFSYAKQLAAALGGKKSGGSDSKQQIEDFIKNYEAEAGGPAALPDAPKYDRVDYKPPTDDELKASAEKGQQYENMTGLESIEKQLAEYQKELDKNKELALAYKSEAQGALDSAYKTAKSSADNDALKRGLARSSIAAAVNAELEKERANKASALDSAVLKQLGEIDSELSSLSAKREKAIGDFNLAQAVKLTEKLEKLKAERESKLSEALKYNNTVAEKEHAAQVDKIMKESDLKTEYLNQTQKEKENAADRQNKKYEAVYGKMRELLTAMDGGSARDSIVNDPAFKDNLNDYYYYLLRSEFAK